jgi:hypothetical protein
VETQRLLDVDAAEARGDLGAALAIMDAHLYDDTGKPFWRPAKMERLTLLSELDGLLPGWATSRWILAQALQSLHPSNRVRNARTMTIASDLRSGTATGSIDTLAAKTKAMDTDWVYRQVFLYELGGLDLFLTKVAAPDLLAGADCIQEWARARMGAYRLVGSTPGLVTWQDLATDELMVTANIGSHAMVVPDELVIGRLVPTVDGPMFESAPLQVPERVARQVVHSPAGWVEALDSARHHDDEAMETAGFEFLMVTDVPTMIAYLMVMSDGGRSRPVAASSNPVDLAHEVWTRVRRLVGDPPDQDPEDIDVWACLSAVVLRPGMGETLGEVLTPDDEDTLAALASQLSEPAATVCRILATGLREAA